MSGISFAWNRISGRGNPDVGSALLGSNLDGTSTVKVIPQPGDFVVLTTNATYSASSYPVVRPLIAADVTALYKEGTPVAGVYGMIQHAAKTNSSGFNDSPLTPTGVATAAMPIYGLPGYAAGIDADPNTGRSRASIVLATENTVFRGTLSSGTATAALVGTLAGIAITQSGSAPYLNTYKIDTGATTKMLAIVGWDETDPAATTVFFQVLDAYCQGKTAVPYSTN